MPYRDGIKHGLRQSARCENYCARNGKKRINYYNRHYNQKQKNHFFHYTNRVIVKVNGNLLKKWEFAAYHTPEGAEFTRELIYTVTGPTRITAEALCNLHRSAGERSLN